MVTVVYRIQGQKVDLKYKKKTRLNLKMKPGYCFFSGEVFGHLQESPLDHPYKTSNPGHYQTHVVPNILPHLRELLQAMKRTVYARSKDLKSIQMPIAESTLLSTLLCGYEVTVVE